MKYLTSLGITLLMTTLTYGQQLFLLTGTYTNGESKGIYVNRFDSRTGAITPVSVTEGVENPSYLAISSNGKFVYAVNENGGTKPGEVSSFSFNKTNGTLTFINKRQTSGAHPCYIATDKAGKWAFTANYTGGSLSAFPIMPDGSLGELAQLIQHEGKGVDARQEKAHVHSTIFTPDQQHLLVSDLGLDKVMIYKFTPDAKQPLSQGADSFFTVKAGNGPRHLAFHPAKPWVYIIEELSGTVSVFRFKGTNFTFMQNLSSHPAAYSGSRGSADIHITPNGRFLYATNRGDANSIAIFAIDSKSGKLSLKGIQSTDGVHPRNFTIDPSGTFVLVANRDSNNIVVFTINQQTGLLTKVGQPYIVPNPVFVGLVK
jgi:6-phosphogluconolactonase